MDEALYLIKHRPQDEVVSEIAQRWVFCSRKEVWIILTTGQRAYPREWTPLSAVAGEMMVRSLPAASGVMR